MLKVEKSKEESGLIKNEKNDNYISDILEYINKGQKGLLNKIDEYLNNNKDNNRIIEDFNNYNKNRFAMLTILWGTYIGTIGALKNKNITNDDLIFLNKISEKKESKNFNEDLNIFIKIINTLSTFYLELKKKENTEKYTHTKLMSKKEKDIKINNINNVNEENFEENIIDEKNEEKNLKNNINDKDNRKTMHEIQNEIKNEEINNINNYNDFNNSSNEFNLLEENKEKIENKISNENIINNNKIKNEKEEKKKFSTCIFCIEEFNEDEITNPLLECYNHIHGKCLANYVEHELNNNKFPIKCPLCPKEQIHDINYKTIHDCLILNDKDNLLQKLENMSLNRLSETNPDEVSFCPTPGCSYMCFYDINEYHLNCPLCKKSYCLKCKTEWHKDLTCQEYQDNKRYEENMTEEDKLNEKKFKDYVKGNRCKQCPKCKRWVEKKEGCDHISCPCGTHFCYRCGEIRDPINPYKHRCPDDKVGRFDGLFNLFNRNNLFNNDEDLFYRRNNFNNNNIFRNFNYNNNFNNNINNNNNVNNYMNNNYNNMNNNYLNNYMDNNYNNMNNNHLNNFSSNNNNKNNLNIKNNLNNNFYKNFNYRNNFNIDNFNNNSPINNFNNNMNIFNFGVNNQNQNSFNPFLNNYNNNNLFNQFNNYSQQNNFLNNQNQLNFNNMYNNRNDTNIQNNNLFKQNQDFNNYGNNKNENDENNNEENKNKENGQK